MPKKFAYKITKKDIVKKLRDLRDDLAKKYKLESYKILNNETIFGIADAMPATPKELLKVKGIGEKKLSQFGDLILSVIHGEVFEEKEKRADAVFSVSEFLDFVNEILLEKTESVRVQGEITGINFNPTGVYFSLKDKDDESVMSCWIPPRYYQGLGVVIEDGMEVKIGGYSNIHKPKGRFSFVVESLELAGEGSLKKAYELLKKKLQKEGLFERKRELPEFIKNIGLITSRTGAAIDDFNKNLEERGHKICFYDVRVEGSKAVDEIIAAVNDINIKKPNLDALVITRGGGSLEDLQAFNNELVARAVFASKIPTICGIGHERDVPIASLVGDEITSTPTAAATLINNSWNRLKQELPKHEQNLLFNFETALISKLNKMANIAERLTNNLDRIFDSFKSITRRFLIFLKQLKERKIIIDDKIDRAAKNIKEKFTRALFENKEKINKYVKYLDNNNPERNLRLGYSIIKKKNGKIIRTVEDIKVGEKLKTMLYRGKFDSRVEKIRK